MKCKEKFTAEKQEELYRRCVLREKQTELRTIPSLKEETNLYFERLLNDIKEDGFKTACFRCGFGCKQKPRDDKCLYAKMLK